MKLENEITVEILTNKEEVIKSLTNNGFKLIEEYDINDIYLVKKEFENCKIYNELLNNSILIRDILEENNAKKMIIGYTDLIKVNDHIMVYQRDNGDELGLQLVNNRIYIEIEEKCQHSGKIYESLDYMKSIIKELNLPIKGENYYAKKAEDILNDRKGNM